MPRHKQVDAPVKKRISLRSSVITQVDAGLIDPFTGKPQFGLWSQLVESLLIQWLDGKIEVQIKPFRADLDDLAGSAVLDDQGDFK
jgi:hypothetical protein